MRTNIEIDDDLMKEAMRSSGRPTEQETVEEALQLLVRIRRDQAAVRKLRGKIHWEGDLDTMRRDR